MVDCNPSEKYAQVQKGSSSPTLRVKKIGNHHLDDDDDDDDDGGGGGDDDDDDEHPWMQNKHVFRSQITNTCQRGQPKVLAKIDYTAIELC